MRVRCEALISVLPELITVLVKKLRAFYPEFQSQWMDWTIPSY